MKKEYIAWQIGDTYLAVQTCDTGYDYTIYDAAYRILDGGQIDNPYKTIDAICAEIIEANGFLCGTPSEIDYNSLMDIASNIL
ncbi:MAG: hypothetical protein E7467_00325 [Ruminococcaceae bacterium]|nr:hypothetical protein [Oscillospiraceae bacterium]